MDFPDGMGRSVGRGEELPEPPKHIMSESLESREDRPYADDAVAVPIGQGEPEPVSLDAMRSNVLSSMSGNFPQDDLDVPAFLRKRNEVM